MMKSKSRLFLVALLSVLLTVAAVFGVSLLGKYDGSFKGVYAGDFTAYAEGEEDSQFGGTSYLLSVDKDYMLLATALKVTDYEAYSLVGYEITENDTLLTGDGLSIDGYYTSITLNTANGTKTLTAEDIFASAEGVTGMMVAEIAYSDLNDYAVKPYLVAIDGETKTEGAACGVVQEKTKTIFEMEAANLPTGTDLYIGRENKPLNEVDYPSGDAYVGNFNKVAAGTTVSMNITSSVAQSAIMSLRCGRGTYAAYMFKMFTLKVNGVEIPVSENVVWENWVEDEAGIGHKYYSWIEKDAVRIPLKQGENVIEFIKIEGAVNTAGTYTNVDYVALSTVESVQWTAEVNGEHSYGAWEILADATTTSAGEIRRYCEHCRDVEIFALPAISTENGWVKAASGVQSIYTYEKDGQIFTYGVEEDVTFTTYTFMAGSETDPFLAENGATLTNVGGPTTNKYGGPFYENSNKTNDREAGVFTFTVNVAETTVVNFYMSFIGKNSSTWENIFTNIKVNGSEEGIDRVTGAYTSPGSWYTEDAKTYLVCAMTLTEGTNVITLTRGTFNLNVNGIAFESVVPVALGAAQA